eukprot:700111-Prymnesium_polylepis.1
MQRYRILPQGTGVASAAEVRAAGDAPPQALVASAALSIQPDGAVRLTIKAVGRVPPEPLAPGWAIKPPTVRTRYTDEQKALLL